MNEELISLRDKIDGIDGQIISLLEARLAVAERMGKIKKQQNETIADPDREKQVIHSLQEKTRNSFLKKRIGEVYEVLFSISREIQEKNA